MPETNQMITQHYFSYLVRIWQDGEAHNGTWLASLEDISTKKLTYFASMAELMCFFNGQYGEDNHSGAKASEPDP